MIGVLLVGFLLVVLLIICFFVSLSNELPPIVIIFCAGLTYAVFNWFDSLWRAAV